MNFFCTKTHYDQWYATTDKNPDYYGLSLDEALAVSRTLFGDGD